MCKTNHWDSVPWPSNTQGALAWNMLKLACTVLWWSPTHPGSASPETPPSSLQPSDVPLQHVTFVLLGWTLALGNGEVSQRVSGLFFQNPHSCPSLLSTPGPRDHHLTPELLQWSLPWASSSALSPSHLSSTERPDRSSKRLNSIRFLPCSKPLSLFLSLFIFFLEWNPISTAVLPKHCGFCFLSTSFPLVHPIPGPLGLSPSPEISRAWEGCGTSSWPQEEWSPPPRSPSLCPLPTPSKFPRPFLRESFLHA